MAPASVGAPIEVEGAIVSAMKPAEDGDGIVVRVANPSEAPRDAVITVATDVAVAPVRMDESPRTDAEPVEATADDRGRRAVVRLGPHETASFRLAVRR